MNARNQDIFAGATQTLVESLSYATFYISHSTIIHNQSIDSTRKFVGGHRWTQEAMFVSLYLFRWHQLTVAMFVSLCFRVDFICVYKVVVFVIVCAQQAVDTQIYSGRATHNTM